MGIFSYIKSAIKEKEERVNYHKRKLENMDDERILKMYNRSSDKYLRFAAKLVLKERGIDV